MCVLTNGGRKTRDAISSNGFRGQIYGCGSTRFVFYLSFIIGHFPLSCEVLFFQKGGLFNNKI